MTKVWILWVSVVSFCWGPVFEDSRIGFGKVRKKKKGGGGEEGVGKAYHRVVWLNLDETAIEDLPQIRLGALRDSGEVVDEGRVEQCKSMLHFLQIACQSRQATLPELSNHEPSFAYCVIHVAHKIEEEFLRKMLDGIKAETLQFQLRAYPCTPFLDIFLHFWMLEIDVGEHEVVVIGVFAVDILGPVLVVSNDFVNGLFLVRGVVVCAGEMIPAVLHR